MLYKQINTFFRVFFCFKKIILYNRKDIHTLLVNLINNMKVRVKLCVVQDVIIIILE